MAETTSATVPFPSSVAACVETCLVDALSPVSLHALVMALGPLANRPVEKLLPEDANAALERVRVALRLYCRKPEACARALETLSASFRDGSRVRVGGVTPAPARAAESSGQVMPVESVQDVVNARNTGKEMARQLGFDETGSVRVATAISELARNIVFYAGKGSVILQAVDRPDGRRGLRFTAQDKGPGIADLATILEGRYKSTRGLGLGLKGVKKLSDDFQVETAPGQGTKVTATKWL
jgi:serine/threonine-protein kinase RsbT